MFVFLHISLMSCLHFLVMNHRKVFREYFQLSMSHFIRECVTMCVFPSVLDDEFVGFINTIILQIDNRRRKKNNKNKNGKKTNA